MGILSALLTLVVLAVTVLSCVSDVRAMRIPNLHSAIILGSFPLAFLAAPESFYPWWHHLAAFAVMFAVTFWMFWANMIGSGDTKLGSVLALWVGLKGLLVYLFYMTLAGGILGALSIVMRRKKFFQNPPAGSWMERAQNGNSVVPYGIAISVGAWGAFLHTGFLHHQLDELFKIIH